MHDPERQGGLTVKCALWQEAAHVVLADVTAATPLRWNWRVTVAEDEEDRPDLPFQAGALTSVRVELHELGWRPPRRPLPTPELWFESDGPWVLLSASVTTMVEAVAFLADAIQDAVIGALHAAWPPCSEHEHPLALGGPDGGSWLCPTSGTVVAPVGQLTPTS
jgi:hypothetical protein